MVPGFLHGPSHEVQRGKRAHDGRFLHDILGHHDGKKAHDDMMAHDRTFRLVWLLERIVGCFVSFVEDRTDDLYWCYDEEVLIENFS